MNRILSATIIAATAAVAIGTPAQASAPKPFLHGALAEAVTTPCIQEDSINCFWNAGKAGNGRGHSFVSVRVGDTDCVIYTERKYNREHGDCFTQWSPNK